MQFVARVMDWSFVSFDAAGGCGCGCARREGKEEREGG